MVSNWKKTGRKMFSFIRIYRLYIYLSPNLSNTHLKLTHVGCYTPILKKWWGEKMRRRKERKENHWGGVGQTLTVLSRQGSQLFNPAPPHPSKCPCTTCGLWSLRRKEPLAGGIPAGVALGRVKTDQPVTWLKERESWWREKEASRGNRLQRNKMW